MERLLHVRPREVAVEGAIRRAIPGVASSHAVEGSFERRVELYAAEVHAAAVERPHGSLRDVGIRRVPGVGERACVEIKFQAPHAIDATVPITTPKIEPTADFPHRNGQSS